MPKDRNKKIEIDHRSSTDAVVFVVCDIFSYLFDLFSLQLFVQKEFLSVSSFLWPYLRQTKSFSSNLVTPIFELEKSTRLNRSAGSTLFLNLTSFVLVSQEQTGNRFIILIAIRWKDHMIFLTWKAEQLFSKIFKSFKF